MKTIVVLSGGMDSAVTLAIAVKNFGKDDVIALTFDYGQRHEREMDAALSLTKHFGVKHIVFEVPLWKIGGSSLTDNTINVPDQQENGKVTSTYVPMRNTIFIALAAAYAEVLGCKHIFVGFNYIDSGRYPDTTYSYVDVANSLLAIGSRDSPVVEAPLVRLTKAQIVQEGEKLNVPWDLSWSCYKGGYIPCGSCSACVQRAKGFLGAGVKDPLIPE